MKIIKIEPIEMYMGSGVWSEDIQGSAWVTYEKGINSFHWNMFGSSRSTKTTHTEMYCCDHSLWSEANSTDTNYILTTIIRCNKDALVNGKTVYLEKRRTA